MGTAAACSKVRVAGFGAALRSRTHAYSAKEPSQMPNTASPGRNRVTVLPTASTRPATSLPRTRVLGFRSP